jgi:CDP-2,3-bis-(O-geranylgeranyl)-sn-glycerol synthase
MVRVCGADGSWVNELLDRLLQLLYLMLPAYAANMAPPFVKYWRGWNAPIAARQLGEHKTVVGFAFGVCAAVVVTFVQSRIGWTGALIDYHGWPSLGVRLGIGAMAGDSVKSFAKRRLGIRPGESWMPFDQLDFVVGALILLGNQARLSVLDYGLILGLTAGGHIVVNHVAYRLGVRDTPW